MIKMPRIEGEGRESHAACERQHSYSVASIDSNAPRHAICPLLECSSVAATHLPWWEYQCSMWVRSRLEVFLTRLDADPHHTLSLSAVHEVLFGDCYEFPIPTASQPSHALMDAALVQTMTRNDLYLCSTPHLRNSVSVSEQSKLPGLSAQSRRKALEFVRDLLLEQAPSAVPHWRSLCSEFCRDASDAPPQLIASTSEQGQLFRRLVKAHEIGDAVDLGDVAAQGKGGEGRVEGGEGSEGRGVLATRRIEADV